MTDDNSIYTVRGVGRMYKVVAVNDLPGELLGVVFSFLEPKDLDRAAQVCRQWSAYGHQMFSIILKNNFKFITDKTLPFLLKKECSSRLYHVFSKSKMVKTILDLPEMTVDSIHARGRTGWTRLHHAVFDGQLIVVDFLYNMLIISGARDNDSLNPDCNDYRRITDKADEFISEYCTENRRRVACLVRQKIELGKSLQNIHESVQGDAKEVLNLLSQLEIVYEGFPNQFLALLTQKNDSEKTPLKCVENQTIEAEISALIDNLTKRIDAAK